MPGKNNKPWISGTLGFLSGAAAGYLYRPPAFLIGQLPFDVVIARGSNLKGLDQIYIEVAKTSFNYLLIGGILGAVIGLVVFARIFR